MTVVTVTLAAARMARSTLILGIFVFQLIENIFALGLFADLNSTLLSYEVSNTSMTEEIVQKQLLEVTTYNSEEYNHHSMTKKEPKIFPKTEREKKGGKLQTVDIIVFISIGVFFILIVAFLIFGSTTCEIKSMNGRKGLQRETQYRVSPAQHDTSYASDKTCQHIFRIS